MTLTAVDLSQPGSAEPGEVPAKPNQQPTILLAFADVLCPTTTLKRVTALARALDAEVRVLQVVPASSYADPDFPRRNLAGIVLSVERILAGQRGARPWVEGVLGEGMPAVQFRVREGDFVAEVASHAAEIKASLIITPPQPGEFGTVASTLALAGNVPVLVAREAAHHGAVVAATDLEDLDYPVVRQAAQLAERLGASLVAVHNIKPNGAVCGVDLIWPIEVVPGASAEAIVRTDTRASDAILREAQKRDADVVVVGTRPHSWLERRLAETVAVNVVNEAMRSVLVIPLGRPDFFQGDLL